jgi:hypothetical protein
VGLRGGGRGWDSEGEGGGGAPRGRDGVSGGRILRDRLPRTQLHMSCAHAVRHRLCATHAYEPSTACDVYRMRVLRFII